MKIYKEDPAMTSPWRFAGDVRLGAPEITILAFRLFEVDCSLLASQNQITRKYLAKPAQTSWPVIGTVQFAFHDKEFSQNQGS